MKAGDASISLLSFDSGSPRLYITTIETDSEDADI